MACLTKLKQDIKLLESAFPKESDRTFRILSASVDEINCAFIDNKGSKHRINANITVRHRVHPKDNVFDNNLVVKQDVNKGCFTIDAGQLLPYSCSFVILNIIC